MHGGAGAIISIGLMNQLPLDFMERCVADIVNGTGENFFLPKYPTLASPQVSESCMAVVRNGQGNAHWPGQSRSPAWAMLAGLLLYRASSGLTQCMPCGMTYILPSKHAPCEATMPYQVQHQQLLDARDRCFAGWLLKRLSYDNVLDSVCVFMPC